MTHTLIYTALGRTFAYGRTEFGAEQVAADSAKMKEWLNGDQGIYYHLFKNGLIKGNRIKHMDGGIQSITEGFKYMQDGKVSMRPSRRPSMVNSMLTLHFFRLTD